MGDVNVGVLLMLSPGADMDRFRAFADAVFAQAGPRIEEASGRSWTFHFEDPNRLEGDDARRPSDFLDTASLAMAEGPYDFVFVVTDVGLMSRAQRLEGGLASPMARVAVVSTRKFVVTPRGRPTRTVDQPNVRGNAATVVLHLIGHMAGLRHTRAGVMAPFRFDEARTEPPSFEPDTYRVLRRRAAALPDDEHDSRSLAGDLWFHLRSAVKHPGNVAHVLLRNRAPLLPLSLPSLATAAVAPSIILIYTAEIWDAGLSMTNRVAWTFAVGTILVATWYITAVQNLFFPRKDKQTVTEHMAVVNVTIFLSMLLAVIGLFVMLLMLLLFLVLYVFPPGLVATWPTLQHPEVTIWDKVRLASFISTMGVATGALAGGLESRAVIRNLAFFLGEP